MKLNYREMGSGPCVIIVHGLMGSASNWQGIAKRLADDYRVLTVDLRNHGDSPHDDDMSYAAMVEDLVEFMQDHCPGKAFLVGHSMGGKAVMALALEHPEKARGVIAVDIAPVPYGHSFRGFTGAMECIPLSHINSRKEAEDYLRDVAPEPAIRAFLLHNLRRGKDKQWHWRINLPVIADQLPAITGFHLSNNALNYHGPTLFIRGGRSTYVLDEHWPEVLTLFPYASLETVPDTGHWLHAEEPEQVTELIREFLETNSTT
jgi:pimeloyl-ACP methyl ester carboxylesterase